MNNPEIVETLNSLLTTLHDGEKGYDEAASETNDAELKTFLLRMSQERKQFAAQLEQEVRQHGGDPETSGSTLAAFHRTWINVRDAITGKDDASIVKEVERGEARAQDNFKDALDQKLPESIAPIVRQQYESIREALNEIKNLATATA